MKETINKLVALQDVLKDIYDLEQLNIKLPKNINILRRQFDPKKDELEKRKNKLKELKSKIMTLESSLSKLEENKAHIDGKMKAIKTQKEFNALSNEKEEFKLMQGELETEILTLQEEKEILDKETSEDDIAYQAEEKKIQEQEKTVADKIDKNNTKIDNLKKSKEELIPGIDKPILNKFEKIVNNKNGFGIVKISNGSCEGCHMAVPPQMINEVRKNSRLISCLNCARILYFPEDENQ